MQLKVRQENMKARTEQVKIGVVVQSTQTPYIRQMEKVTQNTARALRGRGAEVLVRTLDTNSVTHILGVIHELINEGIQGLAVVPIDYPSFCSEIDRIAQLGIPVMTMNADLPSSRRMSYVGLNNYDGGCIAATELLRLIPPQGTILMLVGFLANEAHRQRIDGFMDTCGASAVQLLPLQCNFDRDSDAYTITRRILSRLPSLDGIFIAANGQTGVCNALLDTRKNEQVRVAAFDETEENFEQLRRGNLDIVIAQDVEMQGQLPLSLLYDYLAAQTPPEREFYYTKPAIITRETLWAK